MALNQQAQHSQLTKSKAAYGLKAIFDFYD